jgi:hypothetical protein
LYSSKKGLIKVYPLSFAVIFDNAKSILVWLVLLQ